MPIATPLDDSGVLDDPHACARRVLPFVPPRNRLRVALAVLGVRQKQLQSTGFSVERISAYVTGKMEPPDEARRRLAVELQLPLDLIFPLPFTDGQFIAGSERTRTLARQGGRSSGASRRERGV